MKSTFALCSTLALIVSAAAKEPAKKKTSTTPGAYPSIIQLTPAEPGAAPPAGIIQSELGGREMEFLQTANETGNEQLALADLAKGRSGSEQIKAVADTLASTQVTESKEVARLAAAKHLTLRAGSAKALTDQLGALTGEKFEKAWVEKLIAINEAGAAAYEMGAKSSDADIRSFAEKMLPVAQARLQMANRLGGRSNAAKPAGPPAIEAAAPKPSPAPVAPAKP
jgi:predicted outer membrane protein